MTPERLHAALDARRRELGLVWWQVAVQMEISERNLFGIRSGRLSPALRERAEEWLRRPAPPRTE